MSDYPPPVDRLLAMGPERLGDPWEDYGAIGLGREHIPDLLRMASDPALLQIDPEFRKEPDEQGGDEDLTVWAPLHAWRALGQLRAEDAIGPLLDLLAMAEEKGLDEVLEDLPAVFGKIGPAAMPAMTAVLSDSSRGRYTRIAASTALQEMAKAYPDVRDESVALVSGQLANFSNQDPDFNAFLVGDLVEMKAVEAAPLIERAFEAGDVDESIMGDWPEIRYRLGLGEKPPPRRYDHGLSLPFLRGPVFHADPSQAEKRKARNKARQKMEKKSRQQARKKKRR